MWILQDSSVKIGEVDNMRKVLITVLMLLLMITIMSATTVNAKEVKMSMSGVKEKKILNFTVPIPVLGNFKVYVGMRTKTHGDLTVDLSVNKQTISPNEELEIYVKPISGKLTINRTVIVEVINPKGNVHKKQLLSIHETKDIPGTFSMSIPVPISEILKAVIIAYLTHGAGTLIPAGTFIPIPSIGADVNLKVKTYPKLYIKTEGCYPDLTEVTLYSDKPVTIRVRKTEGVGAKIILDSWNLNSEIYASSEVFGGKYEGNISPVTYKLVDKMEKINEVIATLKTPVKIKLNEIKSVSVGEKTLISGSVSPPASLKLKILCDNNVIAEIRSSSDGKFDYIWIPKIEGEHFIKVVHDGSEFTTPAESNTVEVLVKPSAKPVITTPSETTPQVTKTPSKIVTPAKPTKTPGFEIAIAAIAIGIATILRRKI